MHIRHIDVVQSGVQSVQTSYFLINITSVYIMGLILMRFLFQITIYVTQVIVLYMQLSRLILPDSVQFHVCFLLWKLS